jgi:hypothetical protein
LGDQEPAAAAIGPTLRRLHLRYEGACVLCGTRLEKGTEALYDKAARSVRCVQCLPVTAEPAINAGSAGASAHRQYERRRTARVARVKATLGNTIGGVALALAGEPQSIRAWERGSIGEQKLAEALAGVPDLVVLHDRRVAGTRGNIDHIVIASAGVFVIDAKRYQGLIQIRDKGGLFNRDERLYVGTRDCSELATNMGWQIAAVRQALTSAGIDVSAVPTTPVLCFVDGEWPLLLPPESFRGVRLEGKRSIKKLVVGSEALDAQAIERVGRALAAAFPPK